MTESSSTTIRLAAIGDLLLTTRPGEAVAGRGLEALSPEVRRLFASCDIVVANLECTLPGRDKVPTEPRVFTSEDQVRGLAAAGINVVTLGNNHAFDGGDEGFQRLTAVLDSDDIAWCGAGSTAADAGRPLLLHINGIHIAVIGVVDASSGMCRFAGPASSGVTRLDREALCLQIEALRQHVDHVVIVPHWGEERFQMPSPAQVGQAHAFIDAGASMILGHHPHVVQGMEWYRTFPIVYSLGNFLANHVYWENGDFLTWNHYERTGCILLAELGKDKVQEVRQIPVFDDGETISLDTEGQGERYLNTANRMVLHGITSSRYRRENFRVRFLLPIVAQLRWKNLRRLRPAHFRKAWRLFSNGLK
ncbi:CapA family protein [Desulfoprunum benzoelyticum]|uniref:Poly-gamma-glutamate synthesis protein (Capsule biosynthesis protein) n=1 Tax=Desulfoprunum benzoelyticum TaxID=1506996 RepID=A0A840V1A0_9BACT|nr:CapA family protein [Desulfoprunum benzoelyticum]MBB5346971.1 poly-gamma-glutamate synthesis protein (capsule biosynthesis protein) [Desulfoprunum benzoelyticum]MBM9531011.1 CapA family protein [Desulfoprunum benzoelyticum]